MLGLTLLEIYISVDTDGGRFSVKIPLSEGLNIIRADNSSGKSTCMNAIAYGLGLEAILGPSRKRPFPKSLYDRISVEKLDDSEEDDSGFIVSKSQVTLTVTNNDDNKVKISRDIEGNHNKICVYSDNKKTDYFLGTAGHVGSAKSDRGFHYWLAEFLGWTLPKVAKFDGGETMLYLECIFPLFFVEQKRGWSEIQANIPSQYGIKNIQKAAIEFCLGIGNFDHEKKINKLKNEILDAEREWDIVRDAVENVAEFNVVRPRNLSDLDSKNPVFEVGFSYLENGASYTIDEQVLSLKKSISNFAVEIDDGTPTNDHLESQLASLRLSRRNAEETTESLELLRLSLYEVENKLSRLEHDYDQYLQLKRLQNVGSKDQIDTQKCPICENDLYDTLGNQIMKREPMSLLENIEFLKNQIAFFNSIKDKNLEHIQELQKKGLRINQKISLEKDALYHLREDFDDISGSTKILLREKL